jgi:hypothetical protein
MIAANIKRVEGQTEPAINEEIRRKTSERIAQLRNADLRDLSYRLAELDQEWDVERVLELNFTSVVLGGFVLGMLANRRWLLLPAIASGFMLEHVFEGWCPPLAVLRRLGFRTAAEIQRERTALKILRGDFAHLGTPGAGQTASQDSLLRAVEE